MGTTDPLFEIKLDLPAKGSRESSRALHTQLKAAILDGRLKSGAKLPPTRKSGVFFGVSRNTVVEVYERLHNEGYVVARHGSGSYVADRIPSPAGNTAASGVVTADHRLNAADGHLTRHVRKTRQIYGKRRQRLLKSLQDGCGKWLQPIPSFYGMHVAALGRTSLDLDLVAADLLRQNVKIHTLRRYYFGPGPRGGLIFGYGAIDVPEMIHGLSLLRRTLQKYG